MAGRVRGAARSRRRWEWGVALGILGILATLAAWYWPRGGPAGEGSLPEIYALRVQVLDPQGRPTVASTVRVSAGNEPQRLPDGWWEVEIPAAKLPEDRTVTVWVESEEWSGGRKDLVLGKDRNPRAEIRLEPPESLLRGVVADATGQAIAGARVWSPDAGGAAAETDAGGRFELRLPVPRETRVRVRAEKDGFSPEDTYCYAGRDRCPIEMRQP